MYVIYTVIVWACRTRNQDVSLCSVSPCNSCPALIRQSLPVCHAVLLMEVCHFVSQWWLVSTHTMSIQCWQTRPHFIVHKGQSVFLYIVIRIMMSSCSHVINCCVQCSFGTRNPVTAVCIWSQGWGNS